MKPPPGRPEVEVPGALSEDNAARVGVAAGRAPALPVGASGPAAAEIDLAPNRDLALARYRAHAAGYDASARRSADLRARAIARLGLAPGDTVLDAACGTGLSFPLLAGAVGPRGRVIGVELSPAMAQRARERIARDALAPVTLLQAAMEDAVVDTPVDAVLLHFAHDVLRSPQAVARIVALAKPGARVALAGLMYPPRWLGFLDPWVRARAQPYATTFEGLARPWDRLLPALERFDWTPARLRTVFVGWGRFRR